jgi:hypothetical protein
VDQLDAEVARLTTRALSEPRPLGFSAYVGAADEGDGPVFGELALAGRVQLFPEPSGWAQITLDGLELTRFAALARQQGVAIEDGALDASVRLRLRGARGARVDTTLVFTDLAMHEEENGPLRSTLGLSMPLETALFLLKSPDGEHRLSVGFRVDADGVSRAELVLAATRAAAEVLARALAGVPFRLLGGLFGGGDSEPPPRRVWSASFATGSTELVPAQRAALDEAKKRLSVARKGVLVLRAELSGADIEQAARLANPDAETCLELSARLRQRRAELGRKSRELAIEARALYAVGADEAARATDELFALATELDQVERSLDLVLEILRSDSPRQREKRTRASARRIAELRLEAAREYLVRDLPLAAAERVDVRAARGEATAAGEGVGSVVAELRDR